MSRGLKIVAWMTFLLAAGASSKAAGPAFSQCLPSGYKCNILITLPKQGPPKVEGNPKAPLFLDNITQGQLIGFQNNSNSTVYALHLEVKPGTAESNASVCDFLLINHLFAPNVRVVNIPWGPNIGANSGPLYYFYSLPYPYTTPWATSCDVVFDGGVPKGGSSYFSLDGVTPNYPDWNASVKDVVAFVQFRQGIAKGETADATVTLYPSPSPVTVALNLAPTSGTGSAVFTSTNSSTMTVSQSGTVAIKGVDTSNAVNNVELKASVSADVKGRATFSVVWVTLALRSGSGLAVSSDNAARPQYVSSFGNSNLGAFAQGSSCQTGAEFVGTVQPSGYNGVVVPRRTFLSGGQWDGSALLSTDTTSADDTSFSSLRDDDPQSGGSAGKVYDLDAPGISGGALNHTYRVRSNFSAYAVLDSASNSVPASDSLAWYSVVSCEQTPSGSVLIYDVPNDNQANVGTVPLSWDLQ